MTTDHPLTEAGSAGPEPRVEVYWRPGCVWCANLRRSLRRAGLATSEHQIWSDQVAAAFVRDAAGGNETVPTVAVAGTVLVNPAPGRVIELARAAGAELAPPPRWWHRFLVPRG